MAVTNDSFQGTLEGTDYGDNVDYDGGSREKLETGRYDYTLTITDGKVSFKVQAREFEGNDSWVTVEEKQKIRDGSILNGSFDAESPPDNEATVRFNFNREFASSKGAYELEFHKVS